MDRYPSLLWSIALAGLSMACQPDIGDPCDLPSDCSASGDRICDTTFEGGYCTQFNCEPGECPEEAVCVAFLGAPSSACEDVQETPRFQRTFCMKSCDDNADCRKDEGYRCINVDTVSAWSATVVDKGKPNKKVCMPPYEGSREVAGETEICSPPADASFPPPLESSDASTIADAAPPADAQSAPDAPSTSDAGPPPDASTSTDAAADGAPIDAGVGEGG